MRTFRVLGIAAIAGVALSLWAGGASVGLIGVNEDAPKFATDGGAALCKQMQSIGLQQNVISTIWTKGQGLSSADNARIGKAVATVSGKSIGKPTTGAYVGDLLQATTGQWTGTPTIRLAWLRCPTKQADAGCEPIPGETDPSYTPVAADVGIKALPISLIVRITAKNAEGSATADSPTAVIEVAKKK